MEIVLPSLNSRQPMMSVMPLLSEALRSIWLPLSICTVPLSVLLPASSSVVPAFSVMLYPSILSVASFTCSVAFEPSCKVMPLPLYTAPSSTRKRPPYRFVMDSTTVVRELKISPDVAVRLSPSAASSSLRCCSVYAPVKMISPVCLCTTPPASV